MLGVGSFISSSSNIVLDILESFFGYPSVKHNGHTTLRGGAYNTHRQTALTTTRRGLGVLDGRSLYSPVRPVAILPTISIGFCCVSPFGERGRGPQTHFLTRFVQHIPSLCEEFSGYGTFCIYDNPCHLQVVNTKRETWALELVLWRSENTCNISLPQFRRTGWFSMLSPATVTYRGTLLHQSLSINSRRKYHAYIFSSLHSAVSTTFNIFTKIRPELFVPSPPWPFGL